tara:strand:- start:311 stop:457 length:147 start_codon:yes stop_codon:yes gene_type:complete
MHDFAICAPILHPFHKPAFVKAAIRCAAHEITQCGQSAILLRLHKWLL